MEQITKTTVTESYEYNAQGQPTKVVTTTTTEYDDGRSPAPAIPEG